MTDRLRPRMTPSDDASKRTLYVPKADRAVWARAQEHAMRTGDSLSSIVATALARYLEQEGKHGNDETPT